MKLRLKRQTSRRSRQEGRQRSRHANPHLILRRRFARVLRNSRGPLHRRALLLHASCYSLQLVIKTNSGNNSSVPEKPRKVLTFFSSEPSGAGGCASNVAINVGTAQAGTSLGQGQPTPAG